jgi:acyl-CoA synthetase (AMP-forming)/AMP-acid ligase II/acyl carrier protein
MVIAAKSVNYSVQKALGIVSCNSIDFVTTVFDCFNQGKVAVFLQGREDTYKIQVTGVSEIVEPNPQFGWCKARFSLQHDETLAQIAFTSGTTGQPKGVLLTHGALIDVVNRLNSIMEVDSSIREYIGIPVNYSFGFGRCRAVATAGGEFYIPENGFNPLEIRNMLNEGSINAISAVPSLWRTLFQCADIFGSETNLVKWIEIGSQYMSRREKEQLCQLFPKAKIVQHYGLTEASRTTFLRIDKTNGDHLESVGKAYGQTEIKLSAHQKIMIRGPHVAKELIVDGQLKQNVDDRNWLETNDLGMIKDGYLYYLGRADDLINCGGIKVSPDDIERSIREALGIQSGIAVARASDPMRGDSILVCTLASANLDLQAVQMAAVQAVARFNINSPDAIKLMGFQEFPTTATGKIQRQQLTQLYENHKSAAVAKASTNVSRNQDDVLLTENQREIIAAWKSVLSVEDINIDNNFFEIGGDSLTAISVMISMDKFGISPQIAKGMLQGLSIRELAQRMEAAECSKAKDVSQAHTISNQHTKTGMSINIVRGILVLCVIFGHWSDAFFKLLPAIFMAAKPFLSPVLAAGTPGFAIIYGVSAGYSMFNIFNTDRRRLMKIQMTTASLLAGGILTLALLNFINFSLASDIQSLTDITNLFYGVLTYYLLATLTLPFWFRLISRFKNPATISIFLSVLMYCAYYYLFSPLSTYQTSGFFELMKLMVSAKYSYINLGAGTLAGIAIGILIRDRVEANKPMPDGFIWLGLTFIASGFVIAAHAGMTDEWVTWPLRRTNIWGWLFYSGVVLLALDSTSKLLSRYNQFSFLAKLNFQFLATLGILAFPAFVTHSMVIPVKNIIELTGISGGLSTVIALSLFFLGFGFLFKKVYTTNFTW